jgi:energy-coupling factor transporter ATP-binding protein EcfA2
MYIHKIKLTNIRGFKSLDFDLQRPDKSYAGWTVFTGDNGAGKSTLLKAIAMGLVGPDTRRPLQQSLHRWISAESKPKEGTIDLEIKCTPDDTDLDGKGNKPANIFPVTLKLVNGGKQTEMTSPHSATGKKKSAPERTLWSLNTTGWFSCGYGPFRRVFGASAEATEVMTERATARYATMFLEAASLSPADRWLKDLDHKAAKDNTSREREELDLLLEILKDELMPNGMTIQRVDADGLWLADRNGVELSWSEMSDGYRAALALLTDILRHLSNAHEGSGLKSLVARDDKGRIYMKCSGVVLIDEIDAHLHPEWQREIGFWLKRHFPNIQFLVTTHSPIICQAADPNGLFVLPEPGSGREPQALSDADYHKIIASRPDTILLTPAFGLQNTRSPVAVEARAEYSRLVAIRRAVGKLNAAEQKQFEQLELFALNDEAP